MADCMSMYTLRHLVFMKDNKIHVKQCYITSTGNYINQLTGLSTAIVRERRALF